MEIVRHSDVENLAGFFFPFNNKTHPDCGLYTVDCNEKVQKIQLKRGGHWYEVDYITAAFSIAINDTQLKRDLNPHSCKSIESFSLPSPAVISNMSTPISLTLFNCSPSLKFTSRKEFNHIRCGDYDIYSTVLNNSSRPLEKKYIRSLGFPEQCSIIELPAGYNRTLNTPSFPSSEFTLDVNVSLACYDCYRHGGECQTINTTNEFFCFKVRKGKNKNKEALKLGLAMTAGAIGLLMIMLFFGLKKFPSNIFLSFLWKKQNPAHQSIEVFLRNCGAPQVRRHSYLEVKKMTNSFKEKLGQGWFGSVYKGKLHDGCLVAVKVLNKSKANGEEFINEVATISRTSHVNIVSLLGFCFEGAKKALVYEFMPHGSLEKFIFDESATENSHHLDWETRYQISLGIARGLEYLHRGCNIRILHFDIKPHNILLNAEFVPKISDFGLAKICTRKESLVSMLGPRGTVGYIAPEVFCRNFGGVSHKSDVYSYGMMVLEIVGGRKNVNVRVDNTSEIYFPHWIYKRLELDEEFRLQRITNEDVRIKVRKMIIVSLWCIQTDPSNRPTMSRVIEMLEGSLEFLQIPPKPFLTSPSRSPPAESSSAFL